MRGYNFISSVSQCKMYSTPLMPKLVNKAKNTLLGVGGSDW